MPRYVVLQHNHPFLHWDFLLEQEEDCLAWRLLLPPSPGGSCGGQPLPDHRKHYLSYEGPVSGNRGSVTQFDAGCFARQVLEPDELRLTFDGSQRGMTEVVGQRDEQRGLWWFQFL